jgi:hypothetical protein
MKFLKKFKGYKTILQTFRTQSVSNLRFELESPKKNDHFDVKSFFIKTLEKRVMILPKSSLKKST